ncbi:MAG: helix-turn-helix domain-containing protein [Agathobacter sp.]|nr:helix-turn-helix domain-containing protein [Agathobacter sp.]
MLSAQKLLATLNEIKEISSLDLALYKPNGKVLVSTCEMSVEDMIIEFMNDENSHQSCDTYCFYAIDIENETEYVLVTCGSVDNGKVIGQMAASQIRNLILSKSEEFDRNVFIQNVLLGNMLTIDVFSKAKKLHIEAKPRVTFVIDTGNKNTDIILELVKNLSDLRAGDFVTTVDEHSVVLVKDVSNYTTNLINKEAEFDKELESIAMSLVDSLHMEAMIKVRVGYGNIVTEISDIAQSFQEAKMALQVGRVFYAEKDTISYGKLGIGRLIYQLPMSLCEMFIKEVFGDKIPAILNDEEAMLTINKFFENNLNISETARQLYVHRNTLVYRLERIEEEIGLDIHKFDDAMTFRIAVMVLAHVKDVENSK